MISYGSISVIIPNLNEEKVLPYFLESLKPQTHWLYELVVVDGGSRDDSLEIIDSYEQFYPMVKLIDTTRNLGYVRNLGASCCSRHSEILLFTNSDAVLPPGLLRDISLSFQDDPKLQALSGRTVPYQGGALCFAAYSCFDLLRSFMANHIGKFSPSGNFLAIRKKIFKELGGFPEAPCNEDGILGQRISSYCRAQGLKARFDLSLKTGHFAKRFRKGPLKTILFYSYVFGNFSPALARLLSSVEKSSGEAFKHK